MNGNELSPHTAGELESASLLIDEAFELQAAFDDADLENGNAIALSQAKATLALAITQREMLRLLALGIVSR